MVKQPQEAPHKPLFAHGYTTAPPTRPIVPNNFQNTTIGPNNTMVNPTTNGSVTANPNSNPNPSQRDTNKSSPRYPSGSEIELPDIETDSEEESSDSGKGFVAPEWANSPALRSLLVEQQLVDPEAVFGPIAPLHMDEIFRNKDRPHRFRNRTSSANWSGQDRLTQDEVREDLEKRERLIANGGWSFDL